MIRHHMIENADLFRELAVQRRNRGHHTGKMAAGWDFSRPDPVKGSFERARQSARAAWSAACGDALESFARAVFPERYGDATLDDVIAGTLAAAADAILATF